VRYTEQHMDTPKAHEEDRAAPSRLLALFDYDGTATTHECMEIVLQDLIGDAWRPFEDEVRRGTMGHVECLRRQVALVRAPRHEFLGALSAIAEPRPGLAMFLAAVEAGGGSAAILSAGFREAIEATWRRHGLPPVHLYASELVGLGENDGPPYGMHYNDLLGDCPRCGPGACKATLARALRRDGDLLVYFGDGASDLCPAREADLTFARDYLAELCEAEGLPWRPLDDFAAALHEVRRHMAAPRRAAQPPA
jgi:2-hydroxy-3-keto-5-methylthiopentenyl-1-phosphate phosphatase